MKNQVYVVATKMPWNIQVYHEKITKLPGEWHLISEPSQLSLDVLKKINPKYIFFPHWNHKVTQDILEFTNCVCFHCTDLPYGRGGSPLQNLIQKGHKDTMISAIKMNSELDAGPIYLKSPLSLYGLAEEIFIRASHTIADMIKTIIEKEPPLKEQEGVPSYFQRRKPSDSVINNKLEKLEDLFDHIRMLDADGYPKAFLYYGNYRIEFTRPALKTNEILADVRITQIRDNKDD